MTKWCNIRFALICVLFLTLWCSLASAQILSLGLKDSGTNAEGEMLVPKTLAKRCGLSSDDPQITEDCLKRLCYDYVKGKSIGFQDYNGLLVSVIHDVVKNFLPASATRVTEGGANDDDTKELVGGYDLSSDVSIRNTMTNNRKVAVNNMNHMMDTLAVETQRRYLSQMKTLLYTVVSTRCASLTEEELADDSSLAGPPSD